MTYHRPDRAGPRRGFACPGSKGFTLIELMVTVAVIGILAMVAAPAMTSLVNGNRLAGMTGEMTSSLQLARSEAVRRSAPVTVCRSTNGTTCAAGTDWSTWIVTGRDNVTGVTEVIRSSSAPGTTQLRGPSGGIQFRSSGLIDGEQQLTVCVPTAYPAQNQRVITVMISGNLFTEKSNGGGACP